MISDELSTALLEAVKQFPRLQKRDTALIICLSKNTRMARKVFEGILGVTPDEIRTNILRECECMKPFSTRDIVQVFSRHENDPPPLSITMSEFANTPVNRQMVPILIPFGTYVKADPLEDILLSKTSVVSPGTTSVDTVQFASLITCVTIDTSFLYKMDTEIARKNLVSLMKTVRRLFGSRQSLGMRAEIEFVFKNDTATWPESLKKALGWDCDPDDDVPRGESPNRWLMQSLQRDVHLPSYHNGYAISLYRESLLKVSRTDEAMFHLAFSIREIVLQDLVTALCQSRSINRIMRNVTPVSLLDILMHAVPYIA